MRFVSSQSGARRSCILKELMDEGAGIRTSLVTTLQRGNQGTLINFLRCALNAFDYLHRPRQLSWLPAGTLSMTGSSRPIP